MSSRLRLFRVHLQKSAGKIARLSGGDSTGSCFFSSILLMVIAGWRVKSRAVHPLNDASCRTGSVYFTIYDGKMGKNRFVVRWTNQFKTEVFRDMFRFDSRWESIGCLRTGRCQISSTFGIGTMNLPPFARYSACWARISSAKFHVSSTVKSGWRASSSSAGTMGRCKPGLRRPCL